jgi:hypothetical protein
MCLSPQRNRQFKLKVLIVVCRATIETAPTGQIGLMDLNTLKSYQRIETYLISC